jgi:O-antigen/teichoic acid export membrane protein
LLIGLVFSLNTLLIPKWGIAGAAISTSFALIIYNIGRLIFVWKAYGLSPFTANQIKIISLAIFTLSCGMSLSSYIQLNAWVMISVQIIVIALLFIMPILYFRLDPETSNYFTKLKEALKLRLQA